MLRSIAHSAAAPSAPPHDSDLKRLLPAGRPPLHRSAGSARPSRHQRDGALGVARVGEAGSAGLSQLETPPIATPRSGRRAAVAGSPPPPLPHTTTSAATAAAAAAILCVGAPSAVRRRIELNSYCASQRLGAGVEPPFPRTAPDSAGRGYSRPHTTTSDPTPPHTHPSAPARHNTWA